MSGGPGRAGLRIFSENAPRLSLSRSVGAGRPGRRDEVAADAPWRRCFARYARVQLRIYAGRGESVPEKVAQPRLISERQRQ